MHCRFTRTLSALNYALTTLLSAFLLFQVQPILSKFILPWFGGSPAVWTTCMVFFQVLLFAGYAYAHFSVQMLTPRWQCLVHLGLLALAVAMLPITPDMRWKLDAGAAPTWRILSLLTVSVGLPYFAVAATGPLIQAWFARSFADRSPYRLYALSNVGSLIGLLAYPFLVEPRFKLAVQSASWGIGFVLFVALCSLAAISGAWARQPANDDAPTADQAPADRPEASRRWAWLLLPALASMMLLATTNHVCQDVAVMPFLWVVPLALYLISFIICFDHPRWYFRGPYALAALVAIGAVTVMDQLITGGRGIKFGFLQELVLHFSALFFLCMVCHGELVRLRPHPRYLTSFYLTISGGGALGGLFVSLAAPRLFSTFLEWRLGLLAGGLLAAWVFFDGQQQSLLRRRFVPIAGLLLAAYAGLTAVQHLQSSRGRSLHTSARNFYGVITVLERDADDPARHTFNFYSGRIVHGLQFAQPAKRREPTAYFGRTTGIGQALAKISRQKDPRVGVIGLGVGTLAAYAKPGEYFRFYEINDEVLRFANEHFTYLRDCLGTCEVKLGDARLSLETEPPQNFDLLVLDAFSGDAIPAHLLTKEAFEIYQRHLRPNAVVAVHISNRYLDLSPVVAGLASQFGYDLQRIHTQGAAELGQFPADWIVLSRPTPGSIEEVKTADRVLPAAPEREILWTDDFSNLFEILK
jgi:hypothetical protein